MTNRLNRASLAAASLVLVSAMSLSACETFDQFITPGKKVDIRGERVSVFFNGEFFDYKDMKLAPRPTQQLMPIWVGGGKKPALRRVAARGDGWIPQGNPRHTMQSCIDYIKAHRDKVRPGATIDFGFYPEWIYIGTPFFEANAAWHNTGSPEQIAESLCFAHEVGCTVLHLHFRSRSADEYCDQIAAFARDVWPLVIRP